MARVPHPGRDADAFLLIQDVLEMLKDFCRQSLHAGDDEQS